MRALRGWNALPAHAESWQPDVESIDEVRLEIVGYFSRPSGVGSAARGLLRAAQAAGLHVRSIDADQRDDVVGWSGRLGDRCLVSLLVVNPERMPALVSLVGAERLAQSAAVGHWVWELDRFPEDYRPAFRLLREVWVPSRFAHASISRDAPIPVRQLPYCVDAPEMSTDRARFGLDNDAFVVLTTCDLRSEAARKNPTAAIHAFRAAFAGQPRATLIVKVQNVNHDPPAWRALRRAATLLGSQVRFVTDTLPDHRMSELLTACNVYLSLHRAEGFGLCMAEAMALGKPVVATSYSGNNDFLTRDNSCPIGYSFRTLDTNHGPYLRGNRWAEADIEQAAAQLRRLFVDHPWACELGRCAAETVLHRFAPEVIGRQMRANLEALCGLNCVASPTVRFPAVQADDNPSLLVA